MKAAVSGGSEGSGGMSNEGSGDSGDSGGSEPVVRTMDQWFEPVHTADGP